MMTSIGCAVPVLVGVLMATPVLRSQTVAPTAPTHWAGNVIVPQCRAFPTHPGSGVHITQVAADIAILDQVATTTLDIHLHNPTGQNQEAELLVPVPPGSAVKSFMFEGAASKPTARLLPHEEAVRTYESIVAKLRDPALLEFAGSNLVRSSVFPVAPGGTQRVRLTYEQLLTAEGDRVDYLLPRSENLQSVTPWTITASVATTRPISTLYSASHPIDVQRISETRMRAAVSASAATEPGPFRLSYLRESDGVTASLVAFPEGDGGYFLLLAGLPARPIVEKDTALKREVTIVIDRSGSMQGEKIEQVREAARQIIGALSDGERFNILCYNDQVQRLAGEALIKSERTLDEANMFIDGITAIGGTNIHEALTQALAQPCPPGVLPLVLFMTDGLPTVGQTAETDIRKVAVNGNPHQRRVFTFGVGYDVNVPLLQNLARDTRATATFVAPKENVEMRVAEVYRRLNGPVLALPELTVKSERDGSTLVRVGDMIPDRIPDLFEGDQLVLLGRYRGRDPLNFELRGNFMGTSKTFQFTFNLDQAGPANAFVARLWASRRIGVLVDMIRERGAAPSAYGGRPVTEDPAVRELVDEIIRLSTKFGILTEYTAFLADEGTDFSRRDAMVEACRTWLEHRAVQTRSGIGAVNQAGNIQAQTMQTCSNYGNRFLDENMNMVSISNVQQICDRAFFSRGGRWVDSRLVGAAEVVEPKRTVEFGSDEFHKLVQRLIAENRQGCISLKGDILLDVDGQAVLVKAPLRAGDSVESPPAVAR